MRKQFALIAALSLAPLAASAQYYSAPSYTFGGMMPGMNSGGFQGYGNQYGRQSPFMTMPAPQYTGVPFSGTSAPAPQNYGTPYSQAPALAPAPAPVPPTVQSPPYWMQAPQAAQAPSRYISNVPQRTVGQQVPLPHSGYSAPSYSIFAPPKYAPMAASRQNTTPRWAPMPGQAPVTFQVPRPANNWSMAPAFQNGPSYAPSISTTPPRWPTQ